MQKWVSDAWLAEHYDVSRSTIWRWAAKDLLPAAVQLSPGCTRWSKAEIEQRDAERQQQSAA